MDLVFQLALPIDPKFLPKTRQALSGYLEEVVQEPDQLHDVILALDEACANVIRHAFPGTGHGEYQVRAEITADEVRVQVEDHGVGLDPARMQAPAPDLETTSGRGLHMIRSLMTSVDVEPASADGGTRLLMSKRLDRDL